MKYALGKSAILVLLVSPLPASDPPADLLRRIAAREAENEAARAQYLYRQTLLFEEYEPNQGIRSGFYQEWREVIFSPKGERTERETRRPADHMKSIKLTQEDFDDIRNIQPLLLLPDTLPLYRARFRGEENMDGRLCWVVELDPKQVFQGQRYFRGLLWATQDDYSVVRIEGQAVPPIYRDGTENLFPRFTTLRAPVDGKHWFPVKTIADDTLPFRTGPRRVRFVLEYAGYKRFASDSKITY